MRFTRPATAKAPAKRADGHVLHWVPGYLNSNGQGVWELQDTAAYEARKPGSDCPWSGAARDADPADLAEWTAAQVGYPVALEKSWAALSSATLRHTGREPVYYVRPA